MLINSPRSPDTYSDLLVHYRVATVDASAIATDHGLGSKTQPIVNTGLAGAFATVFERVSLDSVCAAIREEIPLKPEENVAAARVAARTVQCAVRYETVDV